MTKLAKILVAGALGASTLGLFSSVASAAIVCSGTACWHAAEAYEYPADAHVIVHPDTWHWADSDSYSWHEHAGRGYWHGDAWEDF